MLISLVLFIGSGISAQKYITLKDLKKTAKEKKPEQKMNKPKSNEGISQPNAGDVKNTDRIEILAAGMDSNIDEPFIFIARTESDYLILKKLVAGFSSAKEIDFDKQAVVAAFAGTKNTGGYSVLIDRSEGKTHVSVKNPPKDAIVTQALTQPYKIAVIPVEEEDSLDLITSDEFRNKMTTYKIASSEFEFSGGFIGRQTKFQAGGEICVMKFGEYITFAFNLSGKGNEANRRLNEMVSGKISESFATITRLEAGNFMDKPHPPLIVSVAFEANKLSMKFEPGKRDYIVNDGYEGRGSLEAFQQN